MKDILVHMDDGDRCAVRLELAIGLARRFGGRLTGLFARLESHRPSAAAHRASESLVAARDRARSRFESATAAAGIAARWWQLAHGEAAHVVGETTFCARYADLVVLGQHDPKGACVPEELAETVILNCGRPVLVVPHAGHFPSLGEHVAVAWNASKDAVRALHDAKPLMAAAGQVTLLSLHGHRDETVAAMGEVPQVDVIDHLAVGGIKARLEHLAGEHVGKMDLLLSRLCDLGSDLVVMGAHGHEAFSIKRGSATRYVLDHMTIPVLMSN